MKLGPLTITRGAQNAVKPKPNLSELGAPGTHIFGGQLTQQDYNPDLQAPGCYAVYDKMRLGDGQVGAGLNVIKLPILRAHWEVEPASDSPQDVMIAEFCEKDLRGMSTSFGATLRQILLMLDYGSMLMEPVWEIRDDRLVHLRKLAPRLPASVLRWYQDENGGFNGVQQGAIKSSGWSLVDIPFDKLLLFVNEQEGSNFRGISVLRRAYKHWYYKDGMYRIDAIANEKRTVGVDKFTIAAGAQDKEAIKAALETAAMTFHAHEKNYFIADEENYNYDLVTGGGRGTGNAIMQSIEHHDLRILRSVIAEFIAMGSGSTGSLAMHKDKTGFFLMALEATSDNIAEVLTTHLLHRWVDYNWRVTEYPRMKYSRLDTRNVAEIADAVEKLVKAGALTAGKKTEGELRVLLDMPEEDEPYAEPEEEEPGDDQQITRLKAEAAALGFRLRKKAVA